MTCKFILFPEYRNYRNIVWTSTKRIKWKTMAAKQREPIRIIDNTSKNTFQKMLKLRNIEYSQNELISNFKLFPLYKK